ncbi:MAG: B12-binding domain-containing radical SAM protein [Syntrophales bacterium]|jgi:radical SAM superfamily enzyme YgiQ (UPF0313 family)|nr:B12-binding domain-containing radical SAM protein [Syntrophales bacterium]MDY0044195.1 radical SAM protein [Syntrophales bacterium]
MKIAVIASPYPVEEIPTVPLGISYVAAAFASAGAEVQIFDFVINSYSPEKLKAELDRFDPDIVGANSVTLNFKTAADIITTVKEYNPDIITVMGGPHVSFDVINTLREYPAIDMIVIGEGERTAIELVSKFRNRSSWKEVRGIAFRENGNIVITEPRPFIEDLDALPLPARYLLPLSRYRALGYPPSIITGRGCPYSCIFCLGRRMVGKKPRQRSASLIVDEIEEILSYGFSMINIADDLFTANREKVTYVCREIDRRGLKFVWTAFARVNTVDKETLEIMSSSGCQWISFGLESGNAEMLRRVKKAATLDQARHAVGLCKEAGIRPHGSFIAGLPGESPETLEETIAFGEELNIDYGFHFLAPFPGTTIMEKKEKYDIEILTYDWSRYDANSPVTRTSRLSSDHACEIIGRFNNEANRKWQQLEKGYLERTNSPEDDLRVAGSYRLKLVLEILTNDLIERTGIIKGANGNRRYAQNVLEQHLCTKTGCDAELVRTTVESFVGQGLIKTRRAGDGLEWFWTRNNRIEN